MQNKRLAAKERANFEGELIIEVEKVMLGPNCKAIAVYTGDLALVNTRELTNAFVTKFCTDADNEEAIEHYVEQGLS